MSTRSYDNIMFRDHDELDGDDYGDENDPDRFDDDMSEYEYEIENENVDAESEKFYVHDDHRNLYGRQRGRRTMSITVAAFCPRSKSKYSLVLRLTASSVAAAVVLGSVTFVRRRTQSPSSLTHPSTVLRTSTAPFDLYTGNDRLQRAYNLAKTEFYDNIVYTTSDSQAAAASAHPNDGHDGGDGPFFIAGNGWTELWTRDTSYAIELAGGLLEPRVSLLSLLKCTEELAVDNDSDHVNNSSYENDTETVWYQDSCGHFGGWPNLSDAIVGVRGAWSLFLYTGNTTFLRYAYDVTLNTLHRAERDAYHNGLFHGCSSFMESNSGYPKKYWNNGTMVGQTKALSTNVLYYNGYRLAAKMGRILLEEKTRSTGSQRSNRVTSGTIEELDNKATTLKAAIRNRFWMEGRGYYSYFEDEENQLVEQMEGLGESLVLLSDDFEDSGHRIRSILDSTHNTGIGIPCLWPQFDHGNITINDRRISQRYHNGRIWPFVMGFYSIAAARNGRIDLFAEQMLQLMELSEINNTFAEFYDLDKTFPNARRRQLWSDTAFLSMVVKGLFGMKFQVDGIVFSPNKPFPQNFVSTDETISLLNVKYREAIIDVHVKGFGNRVSSCKINDVPCDPKLPSTSVGRFVVEIEVSNAF